VSYWHDKAVLIKQQVHLTLKDLPLCKLKTLAIRVTFNVGLMAL
jgi:hypothetical protein